MPRGRPPSKNKSPNPANPNPANPNPNNNSNNNNAHNNTHNSNNNYNNSSYDGSAPPYSHTPDARSFLHPEQNGKAKAKTKQSETKKKTTAPKHASPPPAQDYYTSPTTPSPASSPPTSPRAQPDTLKIKIKLGPAPSPPLLRILPLEAFIDLRNYLQPFLHHNTSVEWSEAELRNLRTHIEAARASVMEVCTAAGQQAEALDSWRAAAGSPKRKHNDSESKAKGKKKRVHDDFKLTRDLSGDSPYSDMGSEDDDVDVDGEDVDVVDIDGVDEPSAKYEGGGGRGGHSKRGGVNAKMASGMYRGRLAAGTRRQKIMKARGVGRRNKSPNSTPSPTFEDQEIDQGYNIDYDDEEEEEGAPAAPLGPNAFWTAMDAYFRPIAESDLQYLAPKHENPEDPAFRIPPLGSHYLQVWSNEDGEDKKLIGGLNNTRSSTRFATNRGFGSEDDDEDPIIGDLTRRLLASLLEESLVAPRPSSPLPASSSMEDDDESIGNPPVSTTNYSRQSMISLEERIRMELRSIGLLDDMDDIDISEREDDDVCAEIRTVQSMLREQINGNNERKAKLLASVRPKMAEQEAARKAKVANAQIEKHYQKMMQKKKKRGGRRPNSLPVSLPDDAS